MSQVATERDASRGLAGVGSAVPAFQSESLSGRQNSQEDDGTLFRLLYLQQLAHLHPDLRAILPQDMEAFERWLHEMDDRLQDGDYANELVVLEDGVEVTRAQAFEYITLQYNGGMLDIAGFSRAAALIDDDIFISRYTSPRAELPDLIYRYNSANDYAGQDRAIDVSVREVFAREFNCALGVRRILERSGLQESGLNESGVYQHRDFVRGHAYEWRDNLRQIERNNPDSYFVEFGGITNQHQLRQAIADGLIPDDALFVWQNNEGSGRRPSHNGRGAEFGHIESFQRQPDGSVVLASDRGRTSFGGSVENNEVTVFIPREYAEQVAMRQAALQQSAGPATSAAHTSPRSVFDQVADVAGDAWNAVRSNLPRLELNNPFS